MSTLLRILTGSVLLTAGAVAAAWGATPSGGTLSPATPVLTYVGGPYTGANPSNNVPPNVPNCAAVPGTCDDYLLTVDVPPNYFADNPTHVVTIKVSWPNNTNDFDLYIQNPSTEVVITSSATSGDPEIALINPVAGTYRVRTLVFAAVNETITGTITLGPRPASGFGQGIYQPSSDVFTCQTHLTGNGPAFNHDLDGESAVKIGRDGVTWVGGIAGVGGGIGFWKMIDLCAQAFTFVNTDVGPAAATSTSRSRPSRTRSASTMSTCRA